LPSSSPRQYEIHLARHADYYVTLEVHLAVRMTRNAGMLSLAIYLILSGIVGVTALAIPGVLLAALALIAGVLILFGR
jgi:hypothetical protein